MNNYDTDGINYIPGKENTAPDVLSRYSVALNGSEDVHHPSVMYFGDDRKSGHTIKSFMKNWVDRRKNIMEIF